MIRYHNATWWSQVFVFRGGVLTLVVRGLFTYLAYTSLIYYIGVSVQSDFPIILYDESNSIHLLGGFVSFLLIWRLNQCYLRYESGKAYTSTFFSALHGIIGCSCSYIKGSDARAFHKFGTPEDLGDEDEKVKNEALALITRVNVVRLTVSLAVAFKFHSRIAENLNSNQLIDKDQLPGILFDYVRLRGLLFPEEHGIVDDACGLYLYDPSLQQDRETSGESSVGFAMPGSPVSTDTEGSPMQSRNASRISSNWADLNSAVSRNDYDLSSSAAVKRYERAFRDSSSHGRARLAFDGNGSKTQSACALPVLLMQHLRDALSAPIGQKWGYPERLMNVFELHLREVAASFEQLDRLATIPLPLAYLQHCKLLFLFFSLTYPLTINSSHGIWANVFSPCLLFMSLFGFEVLADEMENPIGDDMVDLNTLRMIHDLECRADKIFSMTASERPRLRQALTRPLRDMSYLVLPDDDPGRPGRKTVRGDEPLASHELTEDHYFGAHFDWAPLPVHIVTYCAERELAVGNEVMGPARAHAAKAARQRAGTVQRCCSCCNGVGCLDCESWCCFKQPELEDNEQEVLDRYIRAQASELGLVTHFLCLRSQFHDTQTACKAQTRGYIRGLVGTSGEKGPSMKTIKASVRMSVSDAFPAPDGYTALRRGSG